MLKIAICDDEKFFKIKIEKNIEKYLGKEEIAYEVDSFDSGIQLLEKGENIAEYDMIFLDINMQEIDGIETAKCIRSYSSEIFLIFVTAYVQYSPEGYKVNAIRYLLKDNESFDETFRECMDAILKKLELKKEVCIFNFLDGKKEVLLDEIVCIESNLHKLTFQIDTGKKTESYYMYDRLDNVFEQIQSQRFCRIHKSYLVNLKYVDDIMRYQVILKNGQRLNVAKPRYMTVKNAYISFQGEM